MTKKTVASAVYVGGLVAFAGYIAYVLADIGAPKWVIEGFFAALIIGTVWGYTAKRKGGTK